MAPGGSAPARGGAALRPACLGAVRYAHCGERPQLPRLARAPRGGARPAFQALHGRRGEASGGGPGQSPRGSTPGGCHLRRPGSSRVQPRAHRHERSGCSARHPLVRSPRVGSARAAAESLRSRSPAVGRVGRGALPQRSRLELLYRCTGLAAYGCSADAAHRPSTTMYIAVHRCYDLHARSPRAESGMVPSSRARPTIAPSSPMAASSLRSPTERIPPAASTGKPER